MSRHLEHLHTSSPVKLGTCFSLLFSQSIPLGGFGVTFDDSSAGIEHPAKIVLRVRIPDVRPQENTISQLLRHPAQHLVHLHTSHPNCVERWHHSISCQWPQHNPVVHRLGVLRPSRLRRKKVKKNPTSAKQEGVE